jgi:hypothetical protein
MYKICFYSPEDAVEKVKQAVFSAGAGRIGNYDSCSWQTLGIGQFRPLENSNPAVGKQDQLESVAEYRVEMVCDDEHIVATIAALRKSHPYEEPAFDVWKLEDI